MPFDFPRVQALPDHPDRVSLRLDGVERAGYVFNQQGSRPFFYPVFSPGGQALTRLGHPNPIGHEHHKSVWFGHQFVADKNFWEDRPGNGLQILNQRVTIYQDGESWGGFVAEIQWLDQQKPLLDHQLIACLVARPDGTHALDLQSKFQASTQAVELGRTNFGLLGVRVARTLSARYGGGILTAEKGVTGEPALFEKPSRWMDYSGPSAPDVTEGVTYLDHPENPRHPASWHVRDDGWMVSSFNRTEPYLLAPEHSLTLRYRLWLHDGPADLDRIEEAWKTFAEQHAYKIVPPQGSKLAAIEFEES